MQLTTGFYRTTDAFRLIEEHAAVMDAGNNALMAVTGPAYDAESIALARLFAAAPALLAACRAARRYLVNNVRLERDSDEWELSQQLLEAVTQAANKQQNQQQPLPLEADEPLTRRERFELDELRRTEER